MLDRQMIETAVKRAVSAARAPTRVIIFGSYARGEADESSDLDLLVLERELADKGEEMLRIDRAIGWIGKGVDVLVMADEEFARQSCVPGTVAWWAAREGKVMYDAGA